MRDWEKVIATLYVVILVISTLSVTILRNFISLVSRFLFPIGIEFVSLLKAAGCISGARSVMFDCARR